ncbi:hypothetical protein MPSEU_000289600 [Mayamaea pseudoterrestris]|nr:hypothetical protein MPSEU_000289600 [Mayamaea pseudoterrestris]
MIMGNPRVFDGHAYVDVPEIKGGNPPPLFPDGDGSIFVSIASFRDAERCAETLKSLFENAEHPDKVYVGLSEHVQEQDPKCLELYCQAHGAKILKREEVRADMTKVIHLPDQDKLCPHFDQIRLVATFHVAAKGPIWARSLIRKVLGNEEYCMQVDAHTSFIHNWDTVAKQEWRSAENEFAVISNPPALKSEQAEYEEGSSKAKQVPRVCRLAYKPDNGYPDYNYPAHSWVEDIEKPLLSHAWSSAFSFAKCHLEESAPYDSFSWYAKPIEQFSRFSRFWTRGYDVYTPTRVIAFHDSGPQKNGHGNDEWFRRQRQRFRIEAIDRAKATLRLKQQDGTIASDAVLANMGIYGLGKRRTLKQLEEFTKLEFASLKSNEGVGEDCVAFEYVPFDAAISPVENFYDQPDDLDPQPEFPLRTKLIFYEQLPMNIVAGNTKSGGAVVGRALDSVQRVDSFQRMDGIEQPNLPPFSTLIVLWIFGMIVWCVVFMSQGNVNGSGTPRKKKQMMSKDV